MRKIIFGIITSFLISTPALALEPIQTDAGILKVKELKGGQYALSIGKQMVKLDYYEPSRAQKFGNKILLSFNTGGSACAMLLRWVNVEQRNISVTDDFGTCSERADVKEKDGLLIVTQQGRGSEGEVAFDYDGHRVTKRIVGLGSSETAQKAKNDVSAWVGKSPFKMLTASETEADLIAQIGWDALDEARTSIMVGSNKMVEDGDWITGAGCRPHMCNTDFGAIAIHQKTGKVIVALKAEKGKARLYGKPEASLPKDIREVMTKK